MFPLKPERSTLRATGLLLMLCPVLAVAQAGGPERWPFAGGDLHNTRNASHERRISPETAPQLAVKWIYTTEGDVSATPAVEGAALYFPDWGGWLQHVQRGRGGGQRDRVLGLGLQHLGRGQPEQQALRLHRPVGARAVVAASH